MNLSNPERGRIPTGVSKLAVLSLALNPGYNGASFIHKKAVLEGRNGTSEGRGINLVICRLLLDFAVSSNRKWFRVKQWIPARPGAAFGGARHLSAGVIGVGAVSPSREAL